MAFEPTNSVETFRMCDVDLVKTLVPPQILYLRKDYMQVEIDAFCSLLLILNV